MKVKDKYFLAHILNNFLCMLEESRVIHFTLLTSSPLFALKNYTMTMWNNITWTREKEVKNNFKKIANSFRVSAIFPDYSTWASVKLQQLRIRCYCPLFLVSNATSSLLLILLSLQEVALPTGVIQFIGLIGFKDETLLSYFFFTKFHYPLRRI